MTNTYRALSVLAKSQYGDAVVSLDLTPYDEHSEVSGGHLEIVPRKYRILSDNYTAGKQGEVVELALPKENEAALISGGHLERADAGADGGATSVKEVSADGGQGGKTAPKLQKKED